MIGFPIPQIGVSAAIGAALVAVGLFIDASAYKRGYAAARATQAAVDASAYQEIIKEMQDAGVDVSNPDAVDCELQRLSGESESDECGDLRRDGG